MALCVVCDKPVNSDIVILESSYACHRSCYDAVFPLIVKAIVIGNSTDILHCAVDKA